MATLPPLLALALAPLAGAPAQDGVERVLEPMGRSLERHGGVLVRVHGEQRAELGCTDPGGTGVVRDVAADPAGLTFVAAEHGLYVAAPRIDVLDRIELGEGAPLGSPTCVHVDAQRRVWLATDQAVGVIDPSFWWGRTLEPELLPGGGPYRFTVDGDGALRIAGAGGCRTYVPDRAARPTVSEVRVDGVPVAPGAHLRSEHGEPVHVAAAGTAAGGATFRFRVDGHHVWRDLGGGHELRGLAPGEHALDVVAIDRDLRRSAPVRIRVGVAYPFYYAKGFVAAVGGVAALLVAALFLRRAARERSGRRGVGRALVSTAILLVLVGQVLAGVFPHGKGWPFVGFDMYSERFDENHVVYDGQLVLLDGRGRGRDVDPQAIGVAVDSRWQVLRPLVDGGDAAAREYLATFRGRFPHLDARGLQVQAQRTKLTRSGPVRVAPLVLQHYVETVR